MKLLVIFLDFDGVLNNEHYQERLAINGEKNTIVGITDADAQKAIEILNSKA